MALNFFRQGRLPEAEASIRSLVQSYPEHVEARFMLGIICGLTQRWDETNLHTGFVLSRQPNRAEALYWSALGLKNLDKLPEALAAIERAAQLNPRNPMVLNEWGLVLMSLNRADAAAEAFRRAVRADPSSAAFQFNHGLALARLDLIYKAREAFEEALRLDPKLVSAYLELAKLLETLEERSRATQLLEEASALEPENQEIRVRLAHAYGNEGARDKAESAFRQAMEADPESGHSYGFWLQQEGRFEDSLECFLTSIKAEPVQGVGYYGLAEAKVFTIGEDRLIDRGLSILESPALDVKAKGYLCYAIAKSYEREGSFGDAMKFFELANASMFKVYNEGRPYDRDSLRRIYDRAIARYDAESSRKVREGSSASTKPIFIVGMIRSGTTLLDQIVSSHPSVKTAGEPVFWMQEGDRVCRLPQPELSEEERSDIAERYLAALRTVAGESAHISDKMPLNYAQLGLIHEVFPNAKIVHLRRSPIDTCLSIFTTFLGHGPNFSYDQSNIVFQYLEYMRLMDHWRSVLPRDVFLEIDYEDIVGDRESASRRVIAFLDLEWSDLCLQHEANKSSIRTPSRWQARQPIYRSSVARWRQYEPWLGTLNELKSVAHPKIDY